MPVDPIRSHSYIQRLPERVSVALRHWKPGGSPALAASHDEYWMGRALARAEFARAQNEVPVGALVVRDGDVLGSGSNAVEALQDPTAHAEMAALHQALSVVGSRHLTEVTV